MYYILYNPLSCSDNGYENSKKVVDFIKEENEFTDITKVNYSEYLPKITDEDYLVICGGDGTLNRFVNDTQGIAFPKNILYYATGTGNDFLHDIGHVVEDGPIDIKKYLVDLPVVTVKGKEYRFIDDVGFGIDGYCTEVGDEMRNSSDKPVNYTSIAIKGLLGKFKPANGTVTIDGVKTEYKKIWLAPTMLGRYYGGGMMPTPNQDRLNKDRLVSVMVWSGSGKLATLMNFPKIFKGEHLQKDMCKVFTGHNVVVEFDSPRALQIDGETIKEVTSYEVKWF